MPIRTLTRSLVALVAAFALAACGTTASTTEPDSIAGLAAADGEFTILVAALTEAGLVDTFADAAAGPFTVFAPTDAAFADLLVELDLTAAELLASPDLADILSYHVSPGTQLFADVRTNDVLPTLNGMPIAVDGARLDDRATVIDADLVASNGIVHVIDRVLLPTKTIADIAVADGRFSTLVTALDSAGLVGAVADPDADLTVFAPTNDAFGDALAALNLSAAELLASPDLADILLYHVVPGTFLAADVVAAAPFDAPTLQGSTIAVTVDGGVVLNGSVNVIVTDVKAVNGVIHAIDFVLLPPTP